MARNPLLTKHKTQKRKLRVGNLKRFSAEMINAGSKVGRADIPEDHLGYFDYRGHAKVNPRQEWLDTIFPGVFQLNKHRAAVEQRLKSMQVNGAEPHMHIKMLGSSRNIVTFLFFDSKHTYFYFVQRRFSVVRRSFTYDRKERALNHYKLETIRWEQTHEFTLPESVPRP